MKATCSATARIRSASATEVPPYFWTMSATASTVPDHLARGRPSLASPPRGHRQARTPEGEPPAYGSRSCSASSGASRSASGGSSPGPHHHRGGRRRPLRRLAADQRRRRRRHGHQRTRPVATTTAGRTPRPRCSSRPRCPAPPSRARRRARPPTARSPRTITFAEPPPMCIDAAKTYTATVDDQQGRVHGRPRRRQGAPDGQQLRRALAATTTTTASLCHRIIDRLRGAVRRPDGHGVGRTRLQVPRRAARGRRLHRSGRWPWPTPAAEHQRQPVLHHHRRRRARPCRPHYSLFGQVTRGLRHDRDGHGRGSRTAGRRHGDPGGVPTAEPIYIESVTHHRSLSGSAPRGRASRATGVWPGTTRDAGRGTATCRRVADRRRSPDSSASTMWSGPRRPGRACGGGGRPTTAPPGARRPRVHQPEPEREGSARGSTIGSDSTIAPADEPARTPPSARAACMASHSGVSFSTERRCIGDPPTR